MLIFLLVTPFFISSCSNKKDDIAKVERKISNYKYLNGKGIEPEKSVMAEFY